MNKWTTSDKKHINSDKELIKYNKISTVNKILNESCVMFSFLAEWMIDYPYSHRHVWTHREVATLKRNAYNETPGTSLVSTSWSPASFIMLMMYSSILQLKRNIIFLTNLLEMKFNDDKQNVSFSNLSITLIRLLGRMFSLVAYPQT